MIRTTIALLAVTTLAAPAFAQGDAEAGAAAFKQCKACHAVIDADGNLLAGKGKIGPNLFGVIGRTAGTAEGYKYGKSIVAAGEAGLVWDEEQVAAYVQNPKKYLQTRLDTKKVQAKMSFKVRKEEDAANLAAYLATFSAAN
jgi:cytochrome c